MIGRTARGKCWPLYEMLGRSRAFLVGVNVSPARFSGGLKNDAKSLQWSTWKHSWNDVKMTEKILLLSWIPTEISLYSVCFTPLFVVGGLNTFVLFSVSFCLFVLLPFHPFVSIVHIFYKGYFFHLLLISLSFSVLSG